MYPNRFAQQDTRWAATRLVPEPKEEPDITTTTQASDGLPAHAPPYQRNGWRVVGATSDLIVAVCRQIGRALLVLHGDRLVHKENATQLRLR